MTGAGGRGREYIVGREEGNSNTVAKGSVNNSKGEMAAMGRKHSNKASNGNGINGDRQQQGRVRKKQQKGQQWQQQQW